ncbi:phytanoyl-CoA dioxygenase family protein [Paenibacillus qinlingensis]|uniref:Ectoine hydroxylase-related dioxygenase (Phytanoyl-CoA dioxygenase family) n=1 Tax=Paenibacillus qinlingensis TaxID=1837343 RepID=A0ABU1NWE5_9BACL|nr:phytanoyl-CoA dioxygenase family protein [Paenibacillus qinlingensis]MDR6551768.1 ectoine hydroxylase-related dioxygenase (phytanoyl-CoA dioxygenase family) [Paenibacillus qinlingensis]
MVEQTIDIQALVQQFQTDGYVILRNVLSAEKVELLNSAVDRLISAEEESLSYNWYHSVARDKEFLSLIDEPTVTKLMANILGYNIQLHISHLTVRKPNPNDQKTGTASFIDWHQDGPSPHFPSIAGLTSLYYVKACYILSDMSQPNRGNTKIIPGSHNKAGYKPVQGDVNVPLDGEVQVCGKPGDVFIFGQNLWHAGAPNRSEHTRRQLFMGYSPIWMRPIDYHKASDELLEGANPIQRQLLGDISSNYFKYYVPEPSMVPVKQLLLAEDNDKSVYM